MQNEFFKRFDYRIHGWLASLLVCMGLIWLFKPLGVRTSEPPVQENILKEENSETGSMKGL